MPPKKKAGTGAEASNSPAKFSWTPENDRTLLLLCLNRTTTPADYHNFIAALPPGANFQGVRQRISKLRVEQRALYQEHGWEVVAEAGVRKGKEGKEGKGGGKRKGREDGGEGEGECGKRGKKAKVEVEEEEVEEGVEGVEGEEGEEGGKAEEGEEET